MQHRLQSLAIGAGEQLDALDHRADEVHRLGAIRPFQHQLQLLHLAAVKFRQPRMGDDRKMGGIIIVGCVHQGVALGLQRLHALLHRRNVKPILDRPHQTGDLALDFAALAGALRLIGALLALHLGRLFRDSGHEFRNEIRRKQPLLEANKIPPFDFGAGDRALALASAFLATRGATITILADQRVAATAASGSDARRALAQRFGKRDGESARLSVPRPMIVAQDDLESLRVAVVIGASSSSVASFKASKL
jgi:hypothetical protein